MKARTWPVLAIGFGSLVVLTLLSALDNGRRAGQIYTTMLSLHKSHARTTQSLHEIESAVYLSGTVARDFLLDPSNLTGEMHRKQWHSLRLGIEKNLAALAETTAGTDEQVLNRLRQEIDGYWNYLDPVFDWTPRQKFALSGLFLRKQVLPRREAVLQIAHEAQELNAADLREQQKQIDLRMAEFRRSGQETMVVVLSLALVVSLASILRVSQLETRAQRQHEQTERAEQELRRLSRQLVRAQEDERRHLSRELHDEVGQTLTALRVELGSLEKLRATAGDQFQKHLEDARGLAAQTLQSVRNLAMGLRPSLLDDLGLGAALQWQAREFSRRTGTPVEVLLEGLPADLPDGHRTCLYRVVQEALTNCARHAEARNIRVALHSEHGRLTLGVQDDGRGMTENGAPHLGLVGIEERVRELGGTVAIESQAGKGTLLKVSIPLPKEATA